MKAKRLVLRGALERPSGARVVCVALDAERASDWPMNYCESILAHYESTWSNRATVLRWDYGPTDVLPDTFRVLEFRPTKTRRAWTYATCCMSQPRDAHPVEFHLFSERKSKRHVELLAAIADYHRTGHAVGLGDSVNFGRPWLPRSKCDYGLISLPYLDGPALEWLEIAKRKKPVRFLWLVPVTKAEVEYKKRNGVEALEERLETAGFNYLDPTRKSVV